MRKEDIDLVLESSPGVTDSLLCDVHGFEAHGLIHEAGHAVAALDRGIDFVDVALYMPAQWHKAADGVVAGGVDLGADIGEVALEQPRLYLEFALAGVQAERFLLGHELGRSYKGDINIWRRGVGITGGGQIADMEELVGVSIVSVAKDVERWVLDRQNAVADVAKALQVPDRRLTRAQVAEVLDRRGFHG